MPKETVESAWLSEYRALRETFHFFIVALALVLAFALLVTVALGGRFIHKYRF